jgi:hypothetical protein
MVTVIRAFNLGPTARVERDLGLGGSLVMGRDAWLGRSATPGWWQHGC